MASPAAQAKAQALNAKLEGEARVTIDNIDKQYIRKIARGAHTCAVQCYDKAGTSGSSDVLESCVRNCQMPHQQGHAIVQNEVGQFQNRLNRAMAECQDRARDHMVPGYDSDAKKLAKVEDTLIGCISKTVDEHIKLLNPMKTRIITQLNQQK